MRFSVILMLRALLVAMFCCNCQFNVLAESIGGESLSVDDSSDEESVYLYLKTNPVSPDQQSFPFARNRLLRELVRQQVLIIAREELGIFTRDQSLQERAAENNLSAYVCEVSTYYDERGNFEASLFSNQDGSKDTLWSHNSNVKFDVKSIYLDIIDKLVAESDQLSDGLHQLTSGNTATMFNPDNKPSVEIESQLLEMNFVSQYGALRAAHQSIAKSGASLEWLGVLVRGYANLSMLTEHTWVSQSDVFAARSLLYAERMVRLDPENKISHWNQAYASAIVGLHAIALEQVEQINQGDGAADLPSWVEVIVPYAKFQHDALSELVEDREEISQIASFLLWKQYRSYLHGRLIYEKGIEAMQACPEAYGIYSVMATWSGALRISRIGAYQGPAVFPIALPARIKDLANLPNAVKELCDRPPMTNWMADIPGVSRNNIDQMLPRKICSKLWEASSQESSKEFTWDVLAQLILEEQFNQSVNTIKVSKNAVEHSMTELVKKNYEMSEGSRYADYLRILSPEYVPRSIKLNIYDPRGNMAQVFGGGYRGLLSKNDSQYCWQNYGIRAVQERNLTFDGIIEAFFRIVLEWENVFDAEQSAAIQHNYEVISPYSPNAIRSKWQTRENLSLDELIQYEKVAGDDPLSWMDVGVRYYYLQEFDSAERCLQKSLAISPCYKATNHLANVYYYKGGKDLEKWEQTLLGYLEHLDLGLMHSQIHNQIADVHIQNRHWKRAEPHVIEAAESYSGSALKKAYCVFEGMQDFERAEYYVSELSKSYPSYTGCQWYLWCKRNGCGSIEDSRLIAEKWFENNSSYNNYSTNLIKATFWFLEGEVDLALQTIDKKLIPASRSMDSWNRAYTQLFALMVAAEVKEQETANKAATALRSIIKENSIQQYPNWVVIYEGLLGAFLGDMPEESFFTTFDKTMLGDTSIIYQTNYNAFLGLALDQLGKDELADKYLSRAAFIAPFDRYLATIAGAKLVERHGKSRGGLPEEYAKMEASDLPKDASD